MRRCLCVVSCVGIPADDAKLYLQVGDFEFARRDCLCPGSGDHGRWTFRALAIRKLADEKSPPPNTPIVQHEWATLTPVERAEYLDWLREEGERDDDWVFNHLQRQDAEKDRYIRQVWAERAQLKVELAQLKGQAMPPQDMEYIAGVHGP